MIDSEFYKYITKDEDFFPSWPIINSFSQHFDDDRIDSDSQINNIPQNTEEKAKEDYISLNKKTAFSSEYNNIFLNDENISNNEIIQNNEKNQTTNNQVFKIERRNTRGRKRKDDPNQGRHTKFSDDDMIRTIKSSFFELIRNYINSFLKNQILVKVNSKINKENKVDFNLKLFGLKMKDILSFEPGTGKYKNYNNSIVIKKIYKEKTQEKVIQILDMTFQECFESYTKKNPSQHLEGLDKLYEQLIESKKNKESMEYIEKYKKVAENLVDIFKHKRSRRSKKSKNNYLFSKPF
jgi:hypothetical protein